MDVKIYTPGREKSLFNLLKETFQGFAKGRELAWSLFIRDLKANNRKSILGYTWIFLSPLAIAGIWIFLNQQRVVAIKETPMRYTAFALCGTLLWSLFAESIVKPIVRYQTSISMMGKLNFPREAILLASFYDTLFGLIIRLIILIPFLWFTGYPPTWSFFGAIVFAFGLAICGLVIGIFLSTLGLLYSDIGKGLPIILPLAMYLTPVIYPLRKDGFLGTVQRFNPVTPFLESSRSLFGGYEFTMTNELVSWSVALLVLLLIGTLTLKIALPIIVERSGS